MVKRRVGSTSREAQDTLRALRRAARRALEIGLQTGTPVYVIKDNEIVDLTKQKTRSSEQKRPGKPQSKALHRRKARHDNPDRRH